MAIISILADMAALGILWKTPAIIRDGCRMNRARGFSEREVTGLAIAATLIILCIPAALLTVSTYIEYG
jgi:hypothetical protein